MSKTRVQIASALLIVALALTASAGDGTQASAEQAKPAQAAPGTELLQAFEARYKIWRNGDHLGKASMTMRRNEQGQFEVELDSRATEGMAGFVGAKTIEFSRFSTDNGRAVSDVYTQREKVFIGSSRWRAEFDWQQDLVQVEAKDDWSQPLDGGELDPLNIYLYLAEAAANERQTFEVEIVDDEEMRHYTYRALPGEPLEIACGTFETRVYERTLTDSPKHDVTWHARELAWLPIQVRKTKADGDVMRLELMELNPAQDATLSACPRGAATDTAAAADTAGD